MRLFVMQFRKQYFSVSLARWQQAIGLGVALASGIPVSANAAPREVGIWIDDSGDGAVKIDICGDKLCGRIVWLRNLLNDQGVPKHDRHNPDEGKRNRPICGLPVLGELSPVAEGGFDNGWVYDPKEGKSYTVAIAANGPDKLTVTGYMGVKFLGKSFTWTRAQQALPSCNAQPAAAAGTAGGAAAIAKPSEAKPPVKEQVKKSPPPVTSPSASEEAAAPASSAAEKPAKPKVQKAKVQTLDNTGDANTSNAPASQTKPKSDNDSASSKAATAAAKKKAAETTTKTVKPKTGVEKLPWATDN